MLNLKEHSHIHCVGIGGVGLSAIAVLLLAQGLKVSGSDMKENAHTKQLQKSGATIYIGHAAENIKGADLLIYSVAVSPDNPELIAAREQNIPICTRADALGLLMQNSPVSIAVSGTHGKTTTTSMVSLILEHAGLQPTILIGGNIEEFGGNVKVGNGSYFVTEACEYMDSFLTLKPLIEIIMNIDSDHLDYFTDIEHIVRSFAQFASQVPENGTIFAYEGNPLVNAIIPDLQCRVITFGFNRECGYYATDIEFNSLGLPAFTLNKNGEEPLGRIKLAVPGEHNVINALAAAACCHFIGVGMPEIIRTLEAFNGTQRRFDVLGTTARGLRIVDDYAHHPTEIKATLKAALNIPHKNLWCIFQPHTYTRTRALFDDFAEAFGDADKVILTDIYAAREKNIHKISSQDLADAMKKAHPEKDIYYIPEFEPIVQFILENAQKGDLIISMGAGDVYKVAELLLATDR